jgi:hypothetical protein
MKVKTKMRKFGENAEEREKQDVGFSFRGVSDGSPNEWKKWPVNKYKYPNI